MSRLIDHEDWSRFGGTEVPTPSFLRDDRADVPGPADLTLTFQPCGPSFGDAPRVMPSSPQAQSAGRVSGHRYTVPASPAGDTPVSETAVYETPVSETAVYEAARYEPPVLPAYDASAHAAPVSEAPAYDAPAYQAPAYEAPAYEASAYEAPACQASALEGPTPAAYAYEPAPPTYPSAPGTPAYPPEPAYGPSYDVEPGCPPAYDVDSAYSRESEYGMEPTSVSAAASWDPLFDPWPPPAQSGPHQSGQPEPAWPVPSQPGRANLSREHPSGPLPRASGPGHADASLSDYDVTLTGALGYADLGFRDGRWFSLGGYAPRPITMRDALRAHPDLGGPIVQVACWWMREHPQDPRALDIATELAFAVGELAREACRSLR